MREIKEDLNPKTYFWAYDVFGYLLPGLMLLGGYILTNSSVDRRLHAVRPHNDWVAAVVVLGGAYVLGHLIAAVSSFLLERLIVSRWLQYPTHHFFVRTSEPNKIGNALLSGYLRPYSNDFRRAVEQRFEEKFKLNPSDPHDLFWVTWAYISMYHAAGYKRATHFLELYGFSRNTAMAVLALAPAPLFPGWTRVALWWVWIPGLLIVAYLMFVDYLKLLRRLNDEVFRSFVSLTAN